jgi:hypothetical protein
MISPPLVVLRAIQVKRLTEFLMNRTLPSHIEELTPPEWWLRAPDNGVRNRFSSGAVLAGEKLIPAPTVPRSTPATTPNRKAGLAECSDEPPLLLHARTADSLEPSSHAGAQSATGSKPRLRNSSDMSRTVPDPVSLMNTFVLSRARQLIIAYPAMRVYNN